MNVYAVVIDNRMGILVGPVHVSATSYTEVELKIAASKKYKDCRVAEIKLLGSLDAI